MGRETNKQRREQQAATAREKAAARAPCRREPTSAAVPRRSSARSSPSRSSVAVIAVVAINSGGKQEQPVGRPDRRADAVVSAVTGVTPATYNEVGQGAANLDAVKAISDPATDQGRQAGAAVHRRPSSARSAPPSAGRSSRRCRGSGPSPTSTRSGRPPTTATSRRSASTSRRTPASTCRSCRSRTRTAPAQALETADSTPRTTMWKKYTGQGASRSSTTAASTSRRRSATATRTCPARPGPQIAADLKDPTSKIAKDILGEANIITAMICKMTNGQPATCVRRRVCRRSRCRQASA